MTTPGDPTELLLTATSRRVVRNSFFLISQPLLLNLISLAVTGYLARGLGVDDFGRLNYAFAMSALFASLAGLGLGTVTVRDLVRGDQEPPPIYLGRTLLLRLVAGVVVYAALLLATWLGDLLPEAPWALAVAGTTIFPTLITVTLEDVFRAREQMHHVARVRLSSGLVLTGLSVLFVFCGGRLVALVLLYAAAAYLTCLLASWTLLHHFFRPRPGFDLAFARRVLGQGTIFYAGGILGSLAQRADRLVLERLQGTHAVGVFTAGTTLVDRLAILPEGLGGAVYPALAGLAHRDLPAARRIVGRFVSLAALTGLPVALGGSLLARELILLIFGPEYLGAVAVFRLAVWVVPAWCLIQVLSAALIARQRERTGLAITALGTGLLVLGNIWLVPHYGPRGSALALAASQWVAAACLLVAVLREYRGGLEPGALLRVAAALGLLAAQVLLTRHLHWFVPLLGGGLVYALVVWPLAADLLQQARRSPRPATETEMITGG